MTRRPEERTMTTTCTFCRRRPDRGLVCYRHLDALRDLLDPDNPGSVFDPERPDEIRVLPSIPVLWTLVETRRATTGETGGSTVFRSTPPGDLQKMALRDQRSRPDADTAPWSVLTTLCAIAGQTDRRSVDGQPEAKPVPEVVAVCRWLLTRVDWLVDQPWITDAWHDLHAVHAQLRGAWGDPAIRPVGSCEQLVDDDGQLDPRGSWRCAAPLYLPQQAPRGMDEPVRLPSLRCRSCGWTYTGTELGRIARERMARIAREEAAS